MTATHPQLAAPRSAENLPVFAPERLPWHPAVGERFGIDRASWRALVEAVFPTARTVEGVLLALSYCKARRLDPMKRPVHVVSVWQKGESGSGGKYVDTVWPGIGELRTTAMRTGQFAGCDACEFGPDRTETFRGVRGSADRATEAEITVTFPESAQVTVWRLVAGQRVPVRGPRVYWIETYATQGRTQLPNDMWTRRPRGQLEKCAEAAALRRAFPEEIGNDITDDEAPGAMIDGTLPAAAAAAAESPAVAALPAPLPPLTAPVDAPQPETVHAAVKASRQRQRRAETPEPSEPAEDAGAGTADGATDPVSADPVAAGADLF